MESIRKKADQSIANIRDIESKVSSYTFNVTGDLINQLQKLAKTQIDTDLTALREDATAEFAMGMESAARLSTQNPAGAMGFIDDVAEQLSQKINETYGNLGEAFESKKRGIIYHQKIRAMSQNRATGLKASSQALHNLSNNANSMPPDVLSESIDAVHDVINAEYGNSTGELYAHNAYEISKLRNNVVAGGKYVSQEQPPILTESSPTTELNTKLGTNLRQLQLDNPMLARGFLRIHNLTSADANILAQNIREKYPDSPEAAAIETANRLRSDAIQVNPLEYGSNQLYYSLSADPVDVFTGATDHRFDAAQRAYELFGVTNFFTNKEVDLLKQTSIDVRVGAYLSSEAKLRAYNSKMPNNKRIDPSFLAAEFKKIDSNSVAWGKVLSGFPQFNKISVGEGEAVVENLKKSGIMPKFAVPDQLIRIDGIGGIMEKLAAAHYMQTGDVAGASTFFDTRDNYAYPKTYQYGSRFQDLAKELLHRNVTLVNTGVDTYRVYRLDGTPLIINGVTIQYLGKDLEALAVSKRK